MTPFIQEKEKLRYPGQFKEVMGEVKQLEERLSSVTEWPDNEQDKIREIISERLNEIHESSQWYSARYEAGRILGKDADSFPIDGWMKDISTNLDTKIRGSWRKDWRRRNADEYGEEVEVFDKNLYDRNRVKGAKEDLDGLLLNFRHGNLGKLLELYKNDSTHGKVKSEVGEMIGLAGSYDNVKNAIKMLRKSLQAEIVHQEEKGHEETAMTASHGMTVAEEVSCWVVDKPKIAEPDTKRRETAKEILKEIYKTSEFYSARYETGMILARIDTNIYQEMKEVMPNWIDQITGKIWSMRNLEPDIKKMAEGVEDAIRLWKYTKHPKLNKSFNYAMQNSDDYTKNFIRHKLKVIYNNKGKEGGNIKESLMAGELLGYSKFRLKIHNILR